MANTNNPFGFRLIQPAGKQIFAVLCGKDANAYYPGDLVKLDAGLVKRYAQGDLKAYGVVAEYAPASAGSVYIYNDPDARYKVQTTTFTSPTDIGLNADISATDTPDTTLRHSNQFLDAAENDAEFNLPVKILGLAPGSETGAYAKLIVKLNNTVTGTGNGSGVVTPAG